MSTSVSDPKSSTTANANQPPGNGRSAASRRKDNKTARIWVSIAAGVMLAIVGFLIIRTQGFVSGSEFSPTHFQKRDFRFYEIPLVHLQITPISRSSSTTQAARYLRQKNLIPVVTGPPDVWHLVQISRGLTGATPLDAQLLTDQLELSLGSDAYWEKWSTDHPKMAKVLWPVVQRLAQRELYVLIPRLMEIAQLQSATDQSPADLQNAIDQYLPEQYASLIVDLREAGRRELADGVRQEATADYPDAPNL
ncbi:MAG: hypothetical protein WBD31_25305 [Rubripirellula sp.]